MSDRDLADLEPRIAVQGEDPRHAGQRSGRDGVDGAARHQLFGGLEDQPHPDRKLGNRRQRQRGTQQDRGVRVMPAGVCHIGHGRGVRRAGALRHRQRIHVGAQRDPWLMLWAEVADQSGPAGQHLGVQPRVGQPLSDELSSGVFLAAQLRIAVDVPAPGDQVFVVGGQPRFCGVDEAHTAALHFCAAITRSRSAGVCARWTIVRASMIAPSTTARSALGPAAAAAKARW